MLLYSQEVLILDAATVFIAIERKSECLILRICFGFPNC